MTLPLVANCACASRVLLLLVITLACLVGQAVRSGARDTAYTQELPMCWGMSVIGDAPHSVGPGMLPASRSADVTSLHNAFEAFVLIHHLVRFLALSLFPPQVIAQAPHDHVDHPVHVCVCVGVCVLIYRENRQ